LFSEHQQLSNKYCYKLSNEAIRKLIMDFSMMRAQKCMTHTAAEGSWDFMKAMSSCLNVPTYATVRNRIGKHIPKMSMNFIIKDNKNDTITRVEGSKFNASRFGITQNFTVLSEKCTVSLHDMRCFHHQMHINCKDSKTLVDTIDLSFDGVPLDNSTHKKMMIYSVRFAQCKIVYVFGCHIYTEDNGYTVEECLGPIVKELKETSLIRLRFILADSPMRSFLKGIKGHNGYYSCEICITKGVAVLGTCKPKVVKDNNQTANKKKNQKNSSIYFESRGELHQSRPYTMVRYPSSCFHIKKRTSEEWKIIGQRIVSRKVRGTDNDCGIQGLCPLFELPGFDIIQACPPDPMHFMFLGNGKKIVTSSLQSKHTKKMTLGIDNVYRGTKLTTECQRRTRSMAYVAHFKSSEFRSLIMCAFLLLSAWFHKCGNQAQAKTWLIFCYISRVALLPQPLYRRIRNKIDLSLLVKKFYCQYEETFKKRECVFNIHLMTHIFDIRDNEDFEEMSTEPFESSYNYVKRLYRAGTPSISKQVVENMFILRMKRHICKPCILIEPKIGYSKVRDDLIYTIDMKFYMVIEVMDKCFQCHVVMVEDYHSRIDVSLNFTDVGVMRYCGINETSKVIIRHQDIIAKGVICDNMIYSLPFGSNFT
jgi:hypothetical protein